MGQWFCIGLHKLKEGGINVSEHRAISAKTKKQSQEKATIKKNEDDDDDDDDDISDRDELE